ncbi:GNAT family N-acetyltransferase [Marininema halotolerans]|uniref:Ribosomal protein S18 acetylase RimI n=1 Tax=Marininema halotolerans TaxID=1155944 RepID=A0A1I6R756_9BACL|nr:GNAT family N-acetyltransferase [Marininema halotolerans]SFS60509.1 Ribosomal protein S18 acetylase RimI [Marininema halotolerans]
MPFETRRLQIDKVDTPDLVTLLPIYQSNPTYVNWTEGSLDEHGHLAILQRDWQIAASTSGQHLAAIREKKEDKVIGILEWYDENPTDHYPWLGLLIIHGDEQRKGLGREATEGFISYIKDTTTWRALRIGVLEENHLAQTFWQSLGFIPFEVVEKQFPAGLKRVIKMERQIIS